MVLYISLIRSVPAYTREVERKLVELAKAPPAGIKVERILATFGALDYVLLFDAESPELAMKWIIDNVRAVAGITSTETLQCQHVIPLPLPAEIIISLEEALKTEPPFERLAIPERVLREWVRYELTKAKVTITAEVEDAIVKLVAHTLAKIEGIE